MHPIIGQYIGRSRGAIIVRRPIYRPVACNELNKHLKENCLSTTGVDLVVQSCCKLVGQLGVNPEYGRGIVGFPEFLQALEGEARNSRFFFSRGMQFSHLMRASHGKVR